MKEYLTDKILPKKENLVNRVKAYHERYELQDKVLYHIGIPKCKQKDGRARKQHVVPPKERETLLVHHYDKVGYPGFQRTLARLQENYIWVLMKNDVARHVRVVPLRPVEVTQPLEIVDVDFVGPLPTTEKGNKYIMTMQDYFTRWLAAYTSPEATAETIVEGVHDQSFSRDFGFPNSILLDRRSSSVSKVG